MAEKSQDWRSHLRYAHLGIQFALIVGLIAYGGHFLDAQLGTKPNWTLAGLFLGFGVALYHLCREVLRLEREKD